MPWAGVSRRRPRPAGSSSRMMLPLTTARDPGGQCCAPAELTLGVPANLVEVVRRSPVAQVDAA